MRLRGFRLEAAGPSSLLRPAVSSRPGPASWNNPTVALLRRKRDDSASSQPPNDLAMTIEDVFWIAPPPDAKLDPIKRSMTGRAPGTVLLGELTGSGTLKPGDFVIKEGGRFEIEAIEALRGAAGPRRAAAKHRPAPRDRRRPRGVRQGAADPLRALTGRPGSAASW